jgi:hypothetical protein
MRTTLDIDDDVLLAVKALGRRNKKSAGQVISELARQALTNPSPGITKEERAFYGFRPLPKTPGTLVTNEMINRLRNEELIGCMAPGS